MNKSPWLPRPLAWVLGFLAINVFAENQGKDWAATVNGVVITQNELVEAISPMRQMMQHQLRDNPTELEKALKGLPDKALDDLIDSELLLAEFRKLGGVIQPEYVDQEIDSIVKNSFAGDRKSFLTELERAHMPLSRFRELREKLMIVQVMRKRLSGVPAAPTSAEVQEFYNDNLERFQKEAEIRIRTITIPKQTKDGAVIVETKKTLAMDLRRKILGGADFAALAKTHSQDPRSEQDGLWPWMAVTKADQLIAKAANALNKGNVSELIENETSFIILKVEDKKFGVSKPIEEVRAEIEKLINQAKEKTTLDSWLQNARGKAKIQRFK